MKKFILISFLSLTLSIWAQNHTQTYNGLTGWSESSTDQQKENLQTHTVQPYETVSVEGNFDVTLYDGKEGSIQLNGSQKLLEEVEVENTAKGVVIKYATHWKKMLRNSQNNKAVHVRIPIESIDGVTLSGSGNIHSKTKLKAHQFTIKLSGSGAIDIHLEAESSSLSLSGSGAINLKGKSNTLETKVSGSGSVDCKNLETEVANAKLSGSGKISIQASESIRSQIAGSGNVYVYGNPSQVDTKNAGSGKTKFVQR